MSDPHVESLRYRLTVDERHGRLENPPPLEHETEAYRMRLEDGVLTIEMKEHHATVESARRRVDDDLRAWELDAALSRDHAWLRFDYEGSSIVDRGGPPGSVIMGVGAVIGRAIVAEGVGVSGPPVFHEYPKPPAKFAASPEVEGMFRRFERAIWIDDTQMLSLGYTCLTMLEKAARQKGVKKREGAEGKYRIRLDVLDRIGNWTTTRGGLDEARKLDGNATNIPLTPEENAWLRAAIKMMIRRKAEYDHDPKAADSLPVITMEDLPPV